MILKNFTNLLGSNGCQIQQTEWLKRWAKKLEPAKLLLVVRNNHFTRDFTKRPKTLQVGSVQHLQDSK